MKAKIKVAEATGPALDWLVAKAEGEENHISFDFDLTHPLIMSGIQSYGPSFIWSQGGPIIEREEIGTGKSDGSVWPAGLWLAVHPNDGAYFFGPTPLIAAMRCFVASKLGDEVEVPEALL